MATPCPHVHEALRSVLALLEYQFLPIYLHTCAVCRQNLDVWVSVKIIIYPYHSVTALFSCCLPEFLVDLGKKRESFPAACADKMAPYDLRSENNLNNVVVLLDVTRAQNDPFHAAPPVDATSQH